VPGAASAPDPGRLRPHAAHAAAGVPRLGDRRARRAREAPQPARGRAGHQEVRAQREAGDVRGRARRRQGQGPIEACLRLSCRRTGGGRSQVVDPDPACAEQPRTCASSSSCQCHVRRVLDRLP